MCCSVVVMVLELYSVLELCEFFPLQAVGPGGIVRREGKIVTVKMMLWS